VPEELAITSPTNSHSGSQPSTIGTCSTDQSVKHSRLETLEAESQGAKFVVETVELFLGEEFPP